MGRSTRSVPHSDRAEHEMREQEVLRANRELAAYFRGRRTEREARAALKTIKAFIRYRERLDPAARRPLPGAQPPETTKSARQKKAASPQRVHRPLRQIPAESVNEEEEAVASVMPVPARATNDRPLSYRPQN